LKPGFHFIGSRVGSPGTFKLWVTTQFSLYSPPTSGALGPRGGFVLRDGGGEQPAVRRAVALQVAFWKANFETGFSLDRL
jgi:hypothetical protein